MPRTVRPRRPSRPVQGGRFGHIAVTFAGAILTALPAAAPAQDQGGGEAPPPASVSVVTAQPTDYTMTVRLPGRIKASTISEVRPQVSGIIRERQFEEGAEVEAGQPLYTIEPDTYAAGAAAARAGVAQAQSNFDLAAREADRAEELFANNTTPGQRRDSAIAARESADAALQLAKAELQAAEIDLERTTIRAPIAGVIGFSQATPGTLVAAQQPEPLTTIRALDPVYVDVTQSANDLLQWRQSAEHGGVLATGQATLILPTGDTYPIKGELRAAEPQVEPTTGMIALRIAFPNPDQLLLPGLYVEVELPQMEEEDAYLVPMAAVMRVAKGAPSAWVVENGTVAARPLTVLTSDESNWVVTDGLKPGDQIITAGFQKTGPGAPVVIAPPAGAPAGAPEGAPAGVPAPEAAAGGAAAQAAPAEGGAPGEAPAPVGEAAAPQAPVDGAAAPATDAPAQAPAATEPAASDPTTDPATGPAAAAQESTGTAPAPDAAPEGN